MPVTSLEDGLSKLLMIFYILQINFPKGATSVLNMLARLHGDNRIVSKTSREYTSTL